MQQSKKPNPWQVKPMGKSEGIAELTVTPHGGYGNRLKLKPPEDWRLSLAGGATSIFLRQLAALRLIKQRTGR